MDELPPWAKKHVPVYHPQAAMLVGVSERKLWTMLKEHPHFERRGRRNVYYPEHIEALREVAARPRGRTQPVVASRAQEDRIAAMVAAAQAKRNG